MSLARTLANTSEDGDPGVALDGRANQLHDQHGLADAGAAEHRGLAARDERREKVDDFDPCMEDFLCGAEPIQRRGRCMNRAIRRSGRQTRPAIGRLTDSIQ